MVKYALRALLKLEKQTVLPIRMLVILNTRIPPFSLVLHRNAEVTVCADGGANRWHELLARNKNVIRRKDYMPTLITGDLDSLRPDVYDYFSTNNVPFELDEDQNTTDLQKCLNHFADHRPAIIAGGLGGNVGHQLSTFHTMLMEAQRPQQVDNNLILFDDQQIVLVLPEGRHEIELVANCKLALTPLSGSATVTTSGLKWDLDQEVTFGRNIMSSSNVNTSDIITLTVRGSPLLFTVSTRHWKSGMDFSSL